MCSVFRGRESTAAMSLRHIETNLRHTKASLPDRHTVHESPLYITRASAVQNDFLEPCFLCIKKDFKTILAQWQNSLIILFNFDGIYHT